MNNVMQLVQMIKCGNPKQIAMNLLQQNAKGNPMFENLISLSNNGDNAAIEQICKNIIRSKGMNPDELMEQFQSQFK